ncbi:MAG: non-ribosomal peptide synthetase, partial [Calditrichaeota bacterium]
MDDLAKRIASLPPEKRKLLLKKLKTKTGGASTIPKQKRDTNLFPLSFAQQRLWFLEQLEPNTSIYNIPIAFRLTGSLHVEALKRSLDEIIQRHEVLRTTFTTVNGQPMQLIGNTTEISLPLKDISHLNPVDRNAEFQKHAKQEAERPFNLTHGPLIRASLLKLSDSEHIFFLTIHHIVFDGWSTGILLNELKNHYKKFANHEEINLPDLPIQYADFAVWQRQWLQGEELEKQLSFWKQQLSGAPQILELPLDRPRPPVQTFPGNSMFFKLPQKMSQMIKALSKEAGTTLFMTLLAAFKVLLYRYSGQDDIVIGSPIANRNRPEIEKLIGYFANTLALRTDLSGKPTFRQLLNQVKQVTLNAYEHQDLPFEKLVEELQPQRDLSTSPIFQVMFILQNAPTHTLEFPGLILSPLAGNNNSSRFDLSLYMGEGENGLVGVFEYNTDLFD